MKKTTLLLALISLILFVGCSKDEEVTPTPTPDPIVTPAVVKLDIQKFVNIPGNTKAYMKANAQGVLVEKSSSLGDSIFAYELKFDKYTLGLGFYVNNNSQVYQAILMDKHYSSYQELCYNYMGECKDKWGEASQYDWYKYSYSDAVTYSTYTALWDQVKAQGGDEFFAFFENARVGYLVTVAKTDSNFGIIVTPKATNVMRLSNGKNKLYEFNYFITKQ